MTDGASAQQVAHAAGEALAFRDQLPALQVLLPLLGAPICFLLRKESLASAFTVAIAFACLAISVALLGQTLGGDVLVYEFGGWPRPLRHRVPHRRHERLRAARRLRGRGDRLRGGSGAGRDAPSPTDASTSSTRRRSSA